MSTKIFTAWRMPAARLNDFLDIVRPHMFARVLKDVEALMNDVKPEHVAQEIAKYDGKMAFSHRATERHIRVEAVLKMAAQEAWRNSILAFDCGLNVWLDRGRAYVIPWGHPNYHDGLAVPEWVRDYAYWNNTDRPEEISALSWTRRGNTWDRVALDNWDAHRLVFKVIDMSADGRGHSEITLHFLKQDRAEQARD